MSTKTKTDSNTVWGPQNCQHLPKWGNNSLLSLQVPSRLFTSPQLQIDVVHTFPTSLKVCIIPSRRMGITIGMKFLTVPCKSAWFKSRYHPETAMKIIAVLVMKEKTFDILFLSRFSFGFLLSAVKLFDA